MHWAPGGQATVSLKPVSPSSHTPFPQTGSVFEQSFGQEDIEHDTTQLGSELGHVVQLPLSESSQTPSPQTGVFSQSFGQVPTLHAIAHAGLDFVHAGQDEASPASQTPFPHIAVLVSQSFRQVPGIHAGHGPVEPTHEGHMPPSSPSHIPLPQTGVFAVQSAGQVPLYDGLQAVPSGQVLMISASPVSHIPLPQTGSVFEQSFGQVVIEHATVHSMPGAGLGQVLHLLRSESSHTPSPHTGTFLVQGANSQYGATLPTYVPSGHIFASIVHATTYGLVAVVAGTASAAAPTAWVTTTSLGLICTTSLTLLDAALANTDAIIRNTTINPKIDFPFILFPPL